MAKTVDKKSRHLGSFDLANGQQLLGELRLNGRKTSLKLRHSEFIPPLRDVSTLHGELQDLHKVTCLQCVPNSSGSKGSKDGRESHFADVFPHFVAIGDQHLQPEERCIEAVYFTVDDIKSIFYDFDAFGHVIDSMPLIEAVANANKLDREIPIGDSPQIAYFTGKREVIAVETAMGTVRVRHMPSYSLGGPEGVFIKNHMAIILEPPAPVAFDECIESQLVLLRFLSALAGRRQGPHSIRLKLSEKTGERLQPLHLHWSYRPRGSKAGESAHEPHPADIPLDAVRRPEEFSSVLQHWVSRDQSWRNARVRYAGCLRKGNSYDVDRLVAAANMFDLLPHEAVPLSPEISPELAKAQADCVAIFKQQAQGIERESVIRALKSMAKPSLPKKVLHRVAIVDSRLGQRLPELALVAKIAVKVRNHFVHGGLDVFDFDAVEPLTTFLTDALEFIFYSSDLVEAGWDAEAWNRDLHGWGHSFARFRSNYDLSLAKLKTALGSST